jgi:hypothetical protein
MRREQWCRRFGGTVFGAAAIVLLGSGRVEAQWGYGGFWGGFNVGGWSNAALLNDVNQRSQIAARNAFATRSSIGGGNIYGGNPNAYINHVRNARSDTFFDRQDISTRRTAGSRATAAPTLAMSGRLPTGAATPAPQPAGSDAATAASRNPRVLPLASFFTAVGQLAWPSEAPTNGDLAPKRQAVDRSARAVRDQSGRGEPASISLVTEARTRLLDYGRPALAYVRQHTTPAVADSFNNFLLSLYDSLGAAAEPTAGG